MAAPDASALELFHLALALLGIERWQFDRAPVRSGLRRTLATSPGSHRRHQGRQAPEGEMTPQLPVGGTGTDPQNAPGFRAAPGRLCKEISAKVLRAQHPLP